MGYYDYIYRLPPTPPQMGRMEENISLQPYRTGQKHGPYRTGQEHGPTRPGPLAGPIFVGPEKCPL